MIDRLLVNANVYTLDPTQPRATAIALYRDRIVAVGGAELRERANAGTRIDNMGGALIIPGLVDAHIHWEGTARALHQIDLVDLPDKGAAIRLVAEAAARAEPDSWLIGRGWAQAAWPGGAFPTAADLDVIAPRHPVFLSARSGHAAWVNSAALTLAGITDSTPDPVGGSIQRDAAGHATGILFETAIGRIADQIPTPTPGMLAEQMLEAQTRAWAAGLTGIHDFDDQSAFEALQILHTDGLLGLRVLKNINRAFIAHAIGLRVRFGFGDDWLRIGGLKLFADGALGSLTAAMIDPYANDPANPNNRGIVVTDKEEMIELVTAATLAGLPSTIHAIGDRAVHDVLDVYAETRHLEAAQGIPRGSRRHRIEHVQIIHPADAGRLAALDVIASMQPIHATADYQMADRYWSPPERIRYSYNARLQIDQGARVAFGSDSPVEPFEPLKGIYAAVTRQRPDGSPGVEGWYPAARLTIDEALRGYTEGAAYAAGMDDRLGRIAPGYLADLTVLDRDLTMIAPESILDTKVLGTMTGGIWRFGAWR